MIRLYPKVVVAGQSFVGVKSQTVPNQSMSLREIIKRFIRRESLPVQQDGFYEERFGDLEKIARADITVQMDRAEQIKEAIRKGEERRKKAKESPSAGSPPSGEKQNSQTSSSVPPAVPPPDSTGGVTGKPAVGQAP